jgi:hypothetical protein
MSGRPEPSEAIFRLKIFKASFVWPIQVLVKPDLGLKYYNAQISGQFRPSRAS